jgi:hypothetical protein
MITSSGRSETRFQYSIGALNMAVSMPGLMPNFFCKEEVE